MTTGQAAVAASSAVSVLLSRRADLHARVHTFAKGLLGEDTVEKLAAMLSDVGR